MVRDYDASVPVGTNRIVVCITVQYNSERLIDTAADVADRLNAELHILHVNKGESIFNNADTPMFLEKLFKYGSEKGGMVHMMCSDNVAKAIGEFIEEYGINKVVLGEPPAIPVIGKERIESEFDEIDEILRDKGVEIIMVMKENTPEEAVV